MALLHQWLSEIVWPTVISKYNKWKREIQLIKWDVLHCFGNYYFVITTFTSFLMPIGFYGQRHGCTFMQISALFSAGNSKKLLSNIINRIYWCGVTAELCHVFISLFVYSSIWLLIVAYICSLTYAIWFSIYYYLSGEERDRGYCFTTK